MKLVLLVKPNKDSSKTKPQTPDFYKLMSIMNVGMKIFIMMPLINKAKEEKSYINRCRHSFDKTEHLLLIKTGEK